MPSLTPQHRSDEASAAAFQDGLLSGALALIPSGACVYLATNNYPRFAKATNWQSRTALVIMPALFAFAFSSESNLLHRMREMADEAEHSRATAEWAERRQAEKKRMAAGGGGSGDAAERSDASWKSSSSSFGGANTVASASASASASALGKEETERQLTELYRRGVEQSGVRIVPGDSLGVHHRMSNYLMENPFKVLAGVGVPTVLYIFKGRSSQDHLQLQMKLMHTRVFGQFAVISLLLSLMGFKEYMDRNGKYITEAEAERKVEEMHSMRESLRERLERDREWMAEREKILRKAHDSDLKKLGRLKDGKREEHEGDLAPFGVLVQDLKEEEAEELVMDAAMTDEGRLAKKGGKKKKKTAAVVTEE